MDLKFRNPNFNIFLENNIYKKRQPVGIQR